MTKTKAAATGDDAEVHIYLNVADPSEVGKGWRISCYDKKKVFLVLDKQKNPDKPKEEAESSVEVDKKRLVLLAKKLTSESLVEVWGNDSSFVSQVKKLKRVAIQPIDTATDRKGWRCVLSKMQLKTLIEGDWL